MKHTLVLLKVVAIFLTLNSTTFAHKLPPQVQEIVTNALNLEADLQAGKTIFTNRCSACHGEKGLPRNSRISSTPFLAGQTPKYLLIHMAMFKTKHRKDPIMNSIASSLSTQNMRDIQSFLISDEAQAAHCQNTASVNSTADSIERGRVLAAKKREFQRGDGSVIGISCTMCHGDNGLMPDESREHTMHPDLAGLGKLYLTHQFKAFKENRRVNAGPMNLMVRDLTKRDLEDLSSYYSSLSHCK